MSLHPLEVRRSVCEMMIVSLRARASFWRNFSLDVDAKLEAECCDFQIRALEEQIETENEIERSLRP